MLNVLASFLHDRQQMNCGIFLRPLGHTANDVRTLQSSSHFASGSEREEWRNPVILYLFLIMSCVFVGCFVWRTMRQFIAKRRSDLDGKRRDAPAALIVCCLTRVSWGKKKRKTLDTYTYSGSSVLYKVINTLSKLQEEKKTSSRGKQLQHQQCGRCCVERRKTSVIRLSNFPPSAVYVHSLICSSKNMIGWMPDWK